jgi:hypothetical protein
MTVSAGGHRNPPTQSQLDLAKLAHDSLRQSVVEQDERCGRLLTAIAFFLTAGTAALSIDKVRTASYLFPNGSRVSLPAVLISTFLILSAISAIYLILSVGPQESWKTPYVDAPSFLSFMEVAEASDATWNRVIRIGHRNRQLSYEWESYIRSSRQQAIRAEYKYGRIMEARGVLFIAVSVLAVSLTLTIEALSAVNPADLRWNLKTAIAGSTALAVVTFLAIQDRARNELHTDSIANQDRVPAVFSNLATSFSVYCGLAFMSSAVHQRLGIALVAALELLALAPGFYTVTEWRRARRRERLHAASGGAELPRRSLDSLSLTRLAIITAPGPALLAIPQWRFATIIAAFMPIVAFEGIRLMDAFRSVQVIRSLQRRE